MANLRKARKLLNKTELKSFEPVLSRKLSGLTEAQLKKKISLAKKANTKYRMKARDQKGTAKRRTASSDAAARTEQKAVIFKEISRRLEDQLSKLKQSKIPTKRSAPAKAQHFDQPLAENTGEVKIANRKKRRMAISDKVEDEIGASKHWEKTPLRRIVGFQSGRTRRRQGARDYSGSKV